jgi:hypothetical protein
VVEARPTAWWAWRFWANFEEAKVMMVRGRRRAHKDRLTAELFAHLNEAERSRVKRARDLRTANEENGVVEARDAK